MESGINSGSLFSRFERHQDGDRGIGFDEPNLAAAKIIEQRVQAYSGDFPRPNDLGVIDVRAVINPFPIDIVLRPIAHDDEMPAGQGIELSFDAGTVNDRQACRGIRVLARE